MTEFLNEIRPTISLYDAWEKYKEEYNRDATEEMRVEAEWEGFETPYAYYASKGGPTRAEFDFFLSDLSNDFTIDKSL